MHRARLIASAITGPPGQKFGSWLVKNSPAAFASIQSRTYNVPAASEPFLNGSSSQYVEDMYNAWLVDPASVHAVSVYYFSPLFEFQKAFFPLNSSSKKF